MADVKVSAKLEGFDAAKAEMQEMSASLKRVADAHQASMAKQAEATNALKKHTADLVKEFQDQERATQFANSALGQMASGAVGMGARFFSLAALIAGTVKVLKDIDHAGRESAEMSLRLGAALTATGGVVGFTQHQLEGMADAMAKATRFDDTGIRHAQSIMLTFGNVTGDVFKRGMTLAADYSELLGVDLSSSARILGRALNDPTNGMGMLSRAIGHLDPETQALIKTFQENGDTMRAQVTMIEALEKKFGGFATTIGGSPVAAVEKMKNAWSDLMKEFAKTPDDPTGSKGLFGWYFEGIARNLNYARGYVEEFGEFRKKNEIKVIEELLKSDNLSFQERVAAQKRLTEITKNEGANRVKNEADAKEKEKAHRERMDAEALFAQAALDGKMADEWLAKRKAQTQAALTAALEERKIARETVELEVKNREKELEDYLEFIDIGLATARAGSQEEIALKRERQKVTEEIFKREVELQKTKDELLKEEQKDQKELQDVIADRAKEEIAHLETLNIKNGNLVRMEGDERIRALEAMARKYAAMGSAGVGAYQVIQSEIRKTRTTAEQDFDAMRQVFGRTTFDMVGQFSNLHQSVQSNLADMMKGNQSTADGIKGIFKSMVDSVINEFARLAANDILSGVMQIFGLSSGRTGGSLLGGLLGGGGGSRGDGGGSGGGVGGGNLGTVRNLFSGVGSAADFAGGYAAIEGLSAAEAAALIESGTVGFAGAGMESAALGMGMAEGAATFIPYVGWAMLAAKALGIDVGGMFGGMFGGVGDVVSGIGDIAGDIFGGIGDIFGFATGGESVVTKPTLFLAGESGSERVRVSPLAGGGARGSGGVTNNFYGPTIMDQYSMRLWLREQGRMLRSA